MVDLQGTFGQVKEKADSTPSPRRAAPKLIDARKPESGFREVSAAKASEASPIWPPPEANAATSAAEDSNNAGVDRMNGAKFAGVGIPAASSTCSRR